MLLHCFKKTFYVLSLIITTAFSYEAKAQTETSLASQIDALIAESKLPIIQDYTPINRKFKRLISVTDSSKMFEKNALLLENYMKFILDRTADYDAAYTILEQLYALSNKTSNPKITSRYHFSRGRLFMYENANRTEGAEEFEIAIQLLVDNAIEPDYELLNNVAVSQMDNGDYNVALKTFNHAYKSYKKNPRLGDKDFASLVFLNKGVCHLLLGNLDSSEHFFIKAVDASSISKTLNDDFTSNLYLGVYYQEAGEEQKALEHLSSSLAIKDYAIVDFQEKILLCQGLSETFEQQNKFNKALEYRKLELRYTDSVLEKRIHEKAFSFGLIEDIKSLKQQKKLDKLHAQIQSETYEKQIIIIGGIFLVTLITGSFILYRTNKKRQLNKILATTERLEKERVKQEAELELFRNEEKLISANIELNVQKNEFSQLKSRLTDHLSESHDPEFDDLKKFLNQTQSATKKLEQLKYIDHVLNYSNNEFYTLLKSKHTNLTDDEMRLSTLIRLNLSSKDIEQVFNISNASLMTKRYRLRKKIQLSKSVSLDDYIKQL